jgi:hypothetical protein
MSLSRQLIQRCSCILAIACSLGCLSCGDCVETPSVSSVTPASATAGSASLVLVVNGNHFQRNSTIQWNDADLPTTFVNENQLQATVTADDLAKAAEVKVTVVSPPQSQPVRFSTNATSSATSSVKQDCAGGTSNVANFAVNP